jgi:formiminotetrahydrofolate cyclodeaminase
MATLQLASDVPIREFLNALASADSPHGAVSASAVAGAMGTSLLLMVAALPTTRSDSIDERTALMHAGVALGELQIALRAAADVPLEVIRLCALGLTHAQTVAASSCRAAGGEVELAVALLRLGLTAARSNLEARLSTLADVVYTKAVVEEIAHLAEKAMTAARAAELSVQAPPA